jgi:hypothetical protein
MRNTPKSLNEELNRMKRLMTFNVSENSHDVLSENFVKKSTISEQNLSNYEKLQKQKDDQAKSDAIARKDADKRIWDTQQANIKKETDAEDDRTVSKALQCARTTGIPVIKIQKILIPEDFEQEPLKGLFYSNFVTLTDGLRPNALTTIDTNIQRIIDRLAQYNVKPEDVTITINSSADASSATDDASAKNGATKIDHNYGGDTPNNEYLAKMRGENLGKYLSTKIPGIKIAYKPEVSTEKGGKHIFAKFIGKFDLPIYEDKTTHDLAIGWNLDGYFETTEEWNKNHADCKDKDKDVVYCGCKLPATKDEFFSTGVGRLLKIPANLGGVAYSFVGQTDLIPTKIVNTGAAEEESSCTRLPGVDGKIGRLGGTAQYSHHTNIENVEAYLVSSGYFSADEAKEIVRTGGLLSHAAPRDGSDDDNTISKLGRTYGTTMEVSTEGWDNFLDAFGKTGELNVETARANGAIVIRYDEDDHGVLESGGC